ncbi:MAG: XRE family transcriptional regulator [Chloroflexota bacterium]
MRSSLPDVAHELERVLGQRLTAAIAGVADAKAVGKWARGERAPRPDAEQHLRDAYYVMRLLLQVETPATVRAWFIGMNPELDDRSPALALGEDAARVLQAARTFLAHG